MSPADVPQMWPQEQEGFWRRGVEGGIGGVGGGVKLPHSDAFVHVHSGVGSLFLPLLPLPSRPSPGLFEVEPTCRKEAGIDWRHALEEECVTLSPPVALPSCHPSVLPFLLSPPDFSPFPPPVSPMWLSTPGNFRPEGDLGPVGNTGGAVGVPREGAGGVSTVRDLGRY